MQFVPIGALGRDEARDIDNHSTCLRLTSRYSEATCVLMRRGIHHGKPHAAVAERERELAQAVALHLAGEAAVERSPDRRGGSREKRLQRRAAAGMLTSTTWRRASMGDFALEAFRQQRVVERGEEDQQRAAPQIELQGW